MKDRGPRLANLSAATAPSQTPAQTGKRIEDSGIRQWFATMRDEGRLGPLMIKSDLLDLRVTLQCSNGVGMERNQTRFAELGFPNIGSGAFALANSRGEGFVLQCASIY